VDLTARQRTFLSQFLELYREVKGPLHYSVVAEKLKISNISAYDMLRVLRKRGMVASQYLLPKRRPGPGRSTIVFYPTQRAASLMELPSVEEGERREWEELKERALQALKKRKDDYGQVLGELLSRMPQHKSPLLYTTEMITAIVLQMGQLKEDARARFLRDVRKLMQTGESGLSALADLARLSAESKKALSDFFLEAVRAAEGENGYSNGLEGP